MQCMLGCFLDKQLCCQISIVESTCWHQVRPRGLALDNEFVSAAVEIFLAGGGGRLCTHV